MEQRSVDRSEVRAFVEDYWCGLLLAGQSGAIELGVHQIEAFHRQVGRFSRTMPPRDAAAFVLASEDERKAIFDEWARDPAALRQRLGVAAPVAIIGPEPNATQPVLAIVLGGILALALILLSS